MAAECATSTLSLCFQALDYAFGQYIGLEINSMNYSTFSFFIFAIIKITIFV